MDPQRNLYRSNDPIRVDTLGQGEPLDHPQLSSSNYPISGYQPGSGGQGTAGQIKSIETMLTAEDMRVLRDCNHESFYRRCLPLMVAGGALAHTYFGRMPEPLSPTGKIIGFSGVAIAAWIIGKLSYRRTCEDKILTSGYNSQLVQSLRKRRGMPESEMSSDFSSDEPLAFDWKEDDRQSAMKDDRVGALSRFGDGPTGDKPFYGDDEMSAEGRSNFTSYDNLRQQNRARAVPPPIQSDPRFRPATPYDDKRF